MTIQALAMELKLEVEAVPIEQFIPLPPGYESRHHLIGQYGNVSAYVFDPYSIAISKIDRGFETDLEDVAFLIRQGRITLEELKGYAVTVMQNARDFELNPAEFSQHLSALVSLLG
jgi:hypothetical protein